MLGYMARGQGAKHPRLGRLGGRAPAARQARGPSAAARQAREPGAAAIMQFLENKNLLFF